jgi:voltage-gated potassium channel
MPEPPAPARSARESLREIIFEADTPAGKAFDVVLLISILTSVLCVVLESVQSLDARYHGFFVAIEWMFTVLFTIEYGLRLYCTLRPVRYAVSFFGLVDLLAILPTYISLFVGGTQALLVIRALRLLRVFRIFKLARYLTEATALRHALWASRAKITVFLAAVLIVVVIMGAAMYVVEGPDEPFTSIPRSAYWAVVTMTTVGYGDITPSTVIGQSLAACIMVLGYSFIIIPTGIITAELAHGVSKPITTRTCPSCSLEGHDADADFCKHCGANMENDTPGEPARAT